MKGEGERSRRIDFFQLVASLQRRAPRAAELGHLGRRGLEGGAPEAVRIRPHLSLDFPARDVEAVRWVARDAGPLVEIDVNFGGLYGADSPLPTAFTEELMLDDYAGGTDDLEGVRAFLDIVHHRLYSLLFRAWEKHRWAATFQRDASDEISRFVFALAGLGTRGLDEAATANGALPKTLALRHAALHAHRPRSAGVLRAAVRGLLGERVRVESFVARRLVIAARDRTYLGGASVAGRRIAARRLGRDALVGTRVLDRGTSAHLVIGPLVRVRFDALQPGQPERVALDALVGQLTPAHVDVAVVLVLARGESVETRLGSHGPTPALLGRTVWLGSGAATERALPPRRAKCGPRV